MARQAAHEVALVLTASDETKEIFPHDFELEVVVAVSDATGGKLSQTVPPLACRTTLPPVLPKPRTLVEPLLGVYISTVTPLPLRSHFPCALLLAFAGRAHLQSTRCRVHGLVSHRLAFVHAALWHKHMNNATPDPGPNSHTAEQTSASNVFMQVTCKNNGSEVLPTTQALHTYFCVSDIASVSVVGLEGSPYLDNLAGRAEQPATGQPITVSEEVDRIYTKTGAETHRGLQAAPVYFSPTVLCKTFAPTLHAVLCAAVTFQHTCAL